MAKTVTLKKARPGRAGVVVATYTFSLGKPVKDVPDDVIQTLKQMPGVEIHVSGTRESTSTTPPKAAGGDTA